MRILEQEGLAFDDVLLIPRKSTIDSRFDGEINLSTKIFLGLELKLPIISTNMSTVTESSLASLMYECGGLGIIHRFLEPSEQRKQIEKTEGPRIACIGVGKSSRERLLECSSNKIDGVLIDIAHGHCTAMIEQIKWVKETLDLPVIAGNVATYDGTLDLINAGADCIRCGVGCGSLCTTRLHTGNGVPQLTAIIDCKRAILEVNQPVFLIADGGIKVAGDIVKSLAAGADAVCIGNLLAGCDETPGKVLTIGKKKYKLYAGMASEEAMLSWKGYVSSVEGESTFIPCKGSAEAVLKQLKAGILSGFSYQDAHSIAELQHNAVFIKMTNNGLVESRPHGLL